ncbi:MAG TPA: glycosyltransferase [Actinomycetota bacterium]|nr:glycosyltransferase [Actinomycetota bacterium]
MEIHQFLPYLRRGDAAGNHTIALRRWLLQHGPSEIFVEQADPGVRAMTRHYTEFEPGNGRVALYHAAIGSRMARELARGPAPMVIDYHNVTPARLLAPYDVRATALALSGSIEIGNLAHRAQLAIGHSAFSTRELDDMGFSKTATLPVLIDLSEYERDPDARLQSRLSSSKVGTDLLFVGRVSPHKRQEDVIKSFYAYKKFYDPGARLFLVGGGSSDLYNTTLKKFIEELKVEDVHLTGPVSTPALISYLSIADVLVSMSEHEGFCVPLLEAMKFNIPIIAYASTAVPETLGGAGLLIEEKNYNEIAALIDLVMRDRNLRDRLVKAGAERLRELDPNIHGARYLELITDAA